MQEGRGSETVLEVGSTDLIVTYEDELLSEAVIKMLANDIGRLPVVDRNDKHRLVGYIDRSHVMTGRMRWYEDENLREQRWSVRRKKPLEALDP